MSEFDRPRGPGQSYDNISLWADQLHSQGRFPALPGDRDYDVAIVGGGYSGLWSAYYLKCLRPSWRIAVLEGQVCGFGASGRNGGWLMGALEGESLLLDGLAPAAKAAAFQNIHGIIDEVKQVMNLWQTDCDLVHGGGLHVAARYPQQEQFQRDWLAALHAQGHSEADYRWLDGQAMAQRLNMRDVRGGIFTPHIARIHPAKLVRALCDIVTVAGVDIYERTLVTGVFKDEVHTNRGVVRAGHRILAQEGYSYGMTAKRRYVLPVSSRIIATEPLPESLWQDIGLAGREVFSEGGTVVNYGQRTADNRLVFGARGSYAFGGRPRSDYSGDGAAFERIHQLLLDCLPQLEGAAISHRWGGTLGIPRVPAPHAVYDPATGLGSAGGYLGEGVGASNLMARTLAELVVGEPGELSVMPWAQRKPLAKALRRWEPEPLPWLGFNLVNQIYAWTDGVYAKDSGPIRRAAAASLGRLADWIRG